MRAATSLGRARSVRCLATSQPGSKVEQWLKTPFDVAAFGPRAAFGALVSLPERLQMLQSDVSKLTELAQSPRPIEEKGQLVLQEVESVLVECLQRGAAVETDVLSAVKAALPAELAAAVDGVVPPVPGEGGAAGGGGYGGYNGYGGAAQEDTAPAVVYTADAVADSQMASEVTEIRGAVGGLKSALEALRANADPSRSPMLRLNLREARDMLARRLREATPPGGGSGSGGGAAESLAAARREAQVLLDEVDAQFFASY
ncbi:hypothetical protein Rsub_11466 [Raphidocelis subcapitata]|uniref:Uncharacterized protein n=1 Tax=Raphidocelis subcapitata TaxID=307507 RepID=A0A2V0PIL4_9CHLO|nr:hypothetical protein Rsub_11466 [Raphidocelis subcapitata]|eukprot:GBF98862.1 hypothetical protein Rsub_11466 [Raphidocelis subcapitata]